MLVTPEDFDSLPKEEQARLRSSTSGKAERVDARTYYVHGYMIYKHSVKGTSCDCRDWMFKFTKKKTKKEKNPRCKHIDKVRAEYPEILKLDPKDE